MDIKTGINAGTKTILVNTGEAGLDKKYNVVPDYNFENLLQAVDFILSIKWLFNICKLDNIVPGMRNRKEESFSGLYRKTTTIFKRGNKDYPVFRFKSS